MFNIIHKRDTGARRWVFAQRRFSAVLCIFVEVHVPELQVELRRRPKGCKDDMASTRRPEYPIDSLLVERCDLDEVAFSGVELIKADGRSHCSADHVLSECRVVTRDESKAVSLGFPSKCGDSVFDLNDLNRNGLFADTEDFEIAVCLLFGLGKAVNFNAKIVSTALPVEFALRKKLVSYLDVTQL